MSPDQKVLTKEEVVEEKTLIISNLFNNIIPRIKEHNKKTNTDKWKIRYEISDKGDSFSEFSLDIFIRLNKTDDSILASELHRDFYAEIIRAWTTIGTLSCFSSTIRSNFELGCPAKNDWSQHFGAYVNTDTTRIFTCTEIHITVK